MLLFSLQLVLLKETHSQTPTMPWGVRVTIEGGVVWSVCVGDSPETLGKGVDCGDKTGGGSGSKH